jgi:hypothetical protein
MTLVLPPCEIRASVTIYEQEAVAPGHRHNPPGLDILIFLTLENSFLVLIIPCLWCVITTAQMIRNSSVSGMLSGPQRGVEERQEERGERAAIVWVTLRPWS